MRLGGEGIEPSSLELMEQEARQKNHFHAFLSAIHQQFYRLTGKYHQKSVNFALNISLKSHESHYNPLLINSPPCQIHRCRYATEIL